VSEMNMTFLFCFVIIFALPNSSTYYQGLVGSRLHVDEPHPSEDQVKCLDALLSRLC
jgi:hypothetical protein